jgi:D-alanyl-D-alanine dipeptidase
MFKQLIGNSAILPINRQRSLLILFLLGSAMAFGAHLPPDIPPNGRIMQSLKDIRSIALRAKPPIEIGHFQPPDVVELIKLDPTIALDMLYATENNFLGAAVYSDARAFLQRPVAEAVVRVQHALKKQGYGLLVYDAYRPWYVTKIFWDMTTQEQHKFVANPTEGSRHNRGAAVDLTLIDLETGNAVAMPSDYDEFTERAYPSYNGGTGESRRLRDLLLKAMAAEGFSVYPTEWWHFDHASWKTYKIENRPPEKIVTP